jgi:hypothetical protein
MGRGLDVGDIDGDGDLDVLVVNAGNNAMYMNDGLGQGETDRGFRGLT